MCLHSALPRHMGIVKKSYISFLIATIVACITSFKYETKLNQVRLKSLLGVQLL